MSENDIGEERPTPARAQEGRGAERRRRIVAVAIDHIARLGFEGLRVREVAKEIGINNATLHHHFPTKEDLVAGVIERFVADFEAAQPARSTGDATRELEDYLARTRKLMRAKPAMFLVLNELLIRAARDEDVARLLAPSQERWLEWLLFLLGGAPMTDAEKRRTAERCRHELLGESLALGASGGLLPKPSCSADRRARPPRGSAR